ncbi:MAG: glycosyltransferase family 2 protein [Candidatus Staskawiczbacteria bacterium]|nr:glycosyltransferase family 2 protein [Candidatus Staskawiczbacteria bacterium]
MTDKKIISIIVPIYNEEDNIPLLYNNLTSTLKNIGYNYEIIFINDGSTDKSSVILEEISHNDQQIRYLEFSRNFGKESATSAGLHIMRGNSAIIIDADLQHPIELIPDFIQKWEMGAEMVIGIRNKNVGESLIKKIGSSAFYTLINLMGDTKITPQATDFRLIDRKVIDEFNKFTERQRITRGILDWMGFKKDYIQFDANIRNAGKAKYGFLKKLKLTASSFVTHSMIPLKLAGYLGIFITFFSVLLGIFIIIEKYILNDPLGLKFSGIAILAVFILFLMGILLICLGLIALYIGNIQIEVTNRPLYVIKKSKNI